MKHLSGALLLVVLCLLSASAVYAGEVLTNEKVLNMIKTGFGEETIISKIQASQCSFDVSTDAMIKLKGDGLSENIIKAMIEATNKESSGGQKPSQQKTDFDKAMALKREGIDNEAFKILSRLAGAEPNNNKYQIELVDTLLEQSITLKEAQKTEWKPKAKEAGLKIKMLYPSNIGNPDYYCIFAKYALLVGKKMKAKKALEKAFYFKPGHVRALIIKGDVYSYLAKNPEESPTITQSSTAYDYFKSLEAKEAYESALKGKELSDGEKACICYKLGDLESILFQNQKEAVDYWRQSVSLSPESKWGKLSKERLDGHK